MNVAANNSASVLTEWYGIARIQEYCTILTIFLRDNSREIGEKK